MESINVAGVLKEAGDADSRAHTKSQVYFIICYTSIFIRLSHLYRQFHVHCVAAINDGGWGRCWMVDLYQGVVLSYSCWGFFNRAFVFYSLMPPVSFFM